MCLLEFQSTHPQGVGQIALQATRQNHTFQSTHPQGVGQVHIYEEIRRFGISIHPPARGGTILLDTSAGKVVIISIHPPARGGTSHHPGHAGLGEHFNPPTRKGWDSKSSQNELCILCKSNKIALVSSSRPTFFSCHLSINCYLAYFFGAIPSKYFCSLHLRTAKLFKHFTAYSHIWQQNQEYTWRFSIMSYH